MFGIFEQAPIFYDLRAVSYLGVGANSRGEGALITDFRRGWALIRERFEALRYGNPTSFQGFRSLFEIMKTSSYQEAADALGTKLMAIHYDTKTLKIQWNSIFELLFYH